MQVGFPRRDLGKLKTAMDNTHAIIWVRSNKGTRWARLGQLLGFARATSDKALSATIWDVAVRLTAAAGETPRCWITKTWAL